MARLESGHTPSRRCPEWWGGETPWLALPDIRACDGREVLVTTENTNEDGIANSSARVLPKGTVCLSRTASVGFVTILGCAMATSQDFVNWVCGNELDPKFLMYLLMASRDYIRDLASGATHQTVYMPTVRNFKVCVPPVDRQRNLANGLEAQCRHAEGTVDALSAQLSAIEALPGALLRKAFSGGL